MTEKKSFYSHYLRIEGKTYQSTVQQCGTNYLFIHIIKQFVVYDYTTYSFWGNNHTFE